MSGEDWQEREQEVLRIDVRGEDPSAWARFQEKFVQTLEKLMTTMVDEAEQRTVGDEVRDVSLRAVGALKAIIDKPGVDNEHKIAEIQRELAHAEKLNAEADKVRAETADQRFETAAKKIRLLLHMRKILLLGQSSDPSLLLGHGAAALLEHAQHQSQDAPEDREEYAS